MMENIESIKDSMEFDGRVLDSTMPVIAIFCAQWCEDSEALAPQLSCMADQYRDRIAFYKIDIDEATDLEEQYGIQVTPTVVLFEDGQVRQTWINDQDAKNYIQVLEKLVGAHA
jgi:thioredoxin-like negative regulator of GroEL